MNKTGFRRKTILGLMVPVGLLFFATVQTASAKEILFGASVSLSGKYQTTSKMLQDAYRLWAHQVNQNGGILGRPVKLIFRDDQSDIGRIEQLYEEFVVQEKVDFVLSPYGSPFTSMVVKVTERHGFVFMASSASAGSIWKKGHKRVFGVYATADRYMIGFLDLIARQHLRSVAIGYEDSSFAKSAAEGSLTWSKKFGLEVSLYKAFNHQSPNLPDLLSKMRASKPDAVILCAYTPEVYRFLELMDNAGFKPKATCFTVAPALQEFATKAGPPAEFIFGPSQWEADERIPFPGTRQFIKDFQSFSGREPSYHAGSAFAACQILQRAINHTGSFDHQKISDFIRSLDTVTVIGRFKVDHSGRQVGHNPILIQWQQGKKQIVYPPKMRTAMPVLK